MTDSSNEKIRILFAGTPNFALPTLRALTRWQRAEVVLVLTQPDRRAGRGRNLTAPPIKILAEEEGLNVLQLETLKRSVAEEEILPFAPFHIGVVVAYGLFIPKWLRELPKWGMINAHPSLLPELRGPAPIQWAIINGLKETGVTIQTVEKEIDAGDILWQRRYPIERSDTAITLNDKLSLIAANGVIDTIEMFAAGTVVRRPQDHSKATYAKKLSPEDGFVDWSKSAEEVFNLVRGLLPWPSAWTIREEKRLKIHALEPMDKPAEGKPGEVIGIGKRGIEICCGTNRVCITHIQPAGKAPMHAAQFINGYRVKIGEIWGGRHEPSA